VYIVTRAQLHRTKFRCCSWDANIKRFLSRCGLLYLRNCRSHVARILPTVLASKNGLNKMLEAADASVALQ
jgi:hypothetical protein